MILLSKKITQGPDQGQPSVCALSNKLWQTQHTPTETIPSLLGQPQWPISDRSRSRCLGHTCTAFRLLPLKAHLLCTLAAVKTPTGIGDLPPPPVGTRSSDQVLRPGGWCSFKASALSAGAVRRCLCWSSICVCTMSVRGCHDVELSACYENTAGG